MDKFNTIDEYIAGFPETIQHMLRQIRETIKKAAPDAEECISYQMPAYKYYGPLVYFAAGKNHIGFYPTPSGIEQFKNEFTGLKYSKGAVQFPINKPIPYQLIFKITLFRLNENLQKAAIK